VNTRATQTGRSMATRTRQRGLGGLGMLATVALVVGAAMLALKVIPLYIDDMEVKRALEAIQQEDGLYNQSKVSIRKKLMTRMSAGYSRPLAKDEVKITKKKGLISIDVDYEARVELVGNVDLVAKFTHHIEQQQ